MLKCSRCGNKISECDDYKSTDIEKHKLFREMLQETYMTHRRKVSLTDILFTLTHMRMVIALAKVGLKAMAVYGLTNLLEEGADER